MASDNDTTRSLVLLDAPSIVSNLFDIVRARSITSSYKPAKNTRNFASKRLVIYASQVTRLLPALPIL